jgi:uncharacterized protein (DUF2252 family)
MIDIPDIVSFLKQCNAHRDPSGVSLKYDGMKKDAFRFFRGTPELFYAHIPADSFLLESPATWICGDLHLENFGSYKGSDRRIYFDINDFDGGTLAPCLLDVFRMITSILVSADVLKCTVKEAIGLAETYLNAYIVHLSEGNIRMIAPNAEPGDIKKILKLVAPLKRIEFLDQMIRVADDGSASIRLETGKREGISKQEKNELLQDFKTWARDQSTPAFYKPLDVCKRIAGTGSLGVERYLLLVKGQPVTNGYTLLDVKEARPSFVPGAALVTGAEANRVVAVIRRAVAVPPALLGTFERSDKTFVVREFRGSGENTPMTALSGKLKKTRLFVDMLGALTAWDHLRAGGKSGASNADALMAFGAGHAAWAGSVMAAAQAAAVYVVNDYKKFSRAYRDGAFTIP